MMLNNLLTFRLRTFTVHESNVVQFLMRSLLPHSHLSILISAFVVALYIILRPEWSTVIPHSTPLDSCLRVSGSAVRNHLLHTHRRSRTALEGNPRGSPSYQLAPWPSTYIRPPFTWELYRELWFKRQCHHRKSQLIILKARCLWSVRVLFRVWPVIRAGGLESGIADPFYRAKGLYPGYLYPTSLWWVTFQYWDVLFLKMVIGTYLRLFGSVWPCIKTCTNYRQLCIFCLIKPYQCSVALGTSHLNCWPIRAP